MLHLPKEKECIAERANSMKKPSGASALKVKAVGGDPDTELGSLLATGMIEARRQSSLSDAKFM